MTIKSVSVVGSTGSIGTQTAEVLLAEPGRFSVKAIAAQRSFDMLVEQAAKLRPELVVIGDASLAKDLAPRLPAGTELMTGPEGMVAAATAADVVVNAVVGFAGLPVTLATLNAGRRLALANKESLIAGAPVVQLARRTLGAAIVPVDSEHSAIHQCLQALAPVDVGQPSVPAWKAPDSVRRLVITASGGPFREHSPAQLAAVKITDALRHPTWQMGPKITVDSSTLMNKGLEVIEAHELFGVPYNAIDVVIHPQSIVHSMVEFQDGATIAQLSRPDMRLAIGYALGWPERIGTSFGGLDWTESHALTFSPPDRGRFRCLDLAFRAGAAGGEAPAWLNAANEVAVAAFLGGRLDWLGIAAVVEDVLAACPFGHPTSLEDVLDADRQAREVAQSAITKRAAAA